MTYSPMRAPEAARRVAQPISHRPSCKVCQDQFLIIGCGDRLYGDAAVGPLVAMTVSSWGLRSVEAIAVEQLEASLVLDLAKANYVIFVEPCAEDDAAQTTQVCPISIKNLRSETIHIAGSQCSPDTLLLLARQFYDSCPQSWLIRIPTEEFGCGQKLSSTAQAGMNRALKTVVQFLRTYQQLQQ
ncbi:MAG: hydrogenase maturation protease [Phormidesmis sp.]